jgi:pimeloyl-ACP methyl ester carboxylesterase
VVNDVLAVLGELKRRPNGVPPRAISLGHSLGAAVALYTEILQPGTFEAFVAIEPILVPRQLPPELVGQERAARAVKRRSEFASREEARALWASRPTFRRWDPRALDAYAWHGLRAAEGRWRLKCDPREEAACFCMPIGSEGEFWSRLKKIERPIILVRGADTDNMLWERGSELLEAIVAQLRDVQLLTVAEARPSPLCSRLRCS